jgi:endonuclease YncB( thermonuclease family)
MRVPFSLVTKTKGNGMISINVARAIFIAAMSGCNDGDTCKVHFCNFLPFVADQSLRFEGFDTPERHRPLCADEKAKAQAARRVTLAYMQGDVKLEASGAFDKYDRLLVRAPRLKNN